MTEEVNMLRELKRHTDWYAKVFGPERLQDLDVVVDLDVESYEWLLTVWGQRENLEYDSIRFICDWHVAGKKFNVYAHRDPAWDEQEKFDIMLFPRRDDWSAEEKELWLVLNN
jgi:hypothetical protein